MSIVETVEARMAEISKYYSDCLEFEFGLHAGLCTEAERPIRPKFADSIRNPPTYGTIARKR